MSLPTWYVYYKVAPSKVAALLPRVQAMQAQLAQRWHVQARLQQAVLNQPQQSLHPAQHAPALLTWMEIYQESVMSQTCLQGRSFADCLAAAVDAAAISTWLESARHIECFMELNLCA